MLLVSVCPSVRLSVSLCTLSVYSCVHPSGYKSVSNVCCFFFYFLFCHQRSELLVVLQWQRWDTNVLWFVELQYSCICCYCFRKVSLKFFFFLLLVWFNVLSRNFVVSLKHCFFFVCLFVCRDKKLLFFC